MTPEEAITEVRNHNRTFKVVVYFCLFVACVAFFAGPWWALATFFGVPVALGFLAHAFIGG